MLYERKLLSSRKRADFTVKSSGARGARPSRASKVRIICRFLDGGWTARTAELGWGPLDLFGCDRERPFARVDQQGLLWLVKGGSIVALHRDRAVVQTERGATQTYRRRPVEVGRVVPAWELADAG
jgi:hypothetical protein